MNRKRITAVLLAASLVWGSVMPALAAEESMVETEAVTLEEDSEVSDSSASDSAESETADSSIASDDGTENEIDNEKDQPDDIVQDHDPETSEESDAAEYAGENDGTIQPDADSDAEADNPSQQEDLSDITAPDTENSGELEGSQDAPDTPEEGTVITPITKSITTSDGKDDSEEMFAEYVDRLFDAGSSASGGRKRAQKSVGSKFTGASQVLYSTLRLGAEEIASGQRPSTVFVFTAEDLGYGSSVTWNADDLGITVPIISDGNFSSEAADAAIAKFEQELQVDSIISALLADCPYEFYWHDKTVGVRRNVHISATYQNGEWRCYITGDYTFYFAVAGEFEDGAYTVDVLKTGAATTAVGNAQLILSAGNGLSDIDKLYHFKTAICNAVSYNFDAVNNSTPYGNPWQLIWVFDGDSSTNVVCEGYSKAFQYLCDKAVFSDNRVCAYTATGVMSGGTGAGNHMWNIVTLDDGRNYLADVTNSDSGTVGQTGDLFLVPFTAGSVEAGYTFRCFGDEDIDYTYDAKTLSLFSTEDLTISSVPYGTIPEPDPLEIIGQPQDVSALAGQQVTLHVEANISEVTYQWQWSSNGTTWKNCTSAGCNTDTFSFLMKDSLAGRKYRCIVSTADESVTSDEAEISIAESQSLLEITSQPQDVSALAGQQVTLHVEANISEVTYQWQWSSNGTTWKNCSSAGYNTDTFSFLMKEALAGRKYRCIVSTADESVASDAAEISIAVPQTLLEITSQPQDVSALVGQTVALHVEANLSDVTYQWQWSSNGTTWKNCSSGGYNTDTFSFLMKETLAGRKYRCIVSTAEESVASDAAEISIAVPQTLLEIISQPQDVSALVGQTVTLHVEANLSDVTYQWQWSSNGTTWKNCSSGGFNTDTFSFVMKATLSGRLYRCAVTYDSETVYSDSAEITIDNLPLSITSQPESVCATTGETVSLHVQTNKSNATYQWQWSSDEVNWENCTFTGNNTDTLSVLANDGITGKYFRCMVSYANDTLYSDIVTISLVLYSGQCGDNANWTLDSQGVFTVSGTGDMWSFDDSHDTIPWKDHLNDINKLVVNEGITSIGNNAFENASNLCDLELPNTLTAICFRAFNGCRSLDEIDLPYGLHSVEQEAFGYTTITTLTFPETISFIDGSVCCYCDKLKTVYIKKCNQPSFVFGTSPFFWCKSLEGIYVEEGHYALHDVDGVLFYGNNVVQYPCAKKGDSFTVPAGGTIMDYAFRETEYLKHIDLSNMTTIPERACFSCHGLTSVTFPDSITSIPANMFTDCVSLTSIAIPESVTSIGDYAFSMCTGLTEITIPEYLSSIGTGCFQRCESLTSITIPNGITSIDDWMFCDCYDLASVTLPSGITNIGNKAFSYCRSLTTFEIPSSVTSIGAYAFSFCSNLSSIVIPDGITSIEDSMFRGCSSLNSIVIPDSVTVIGDEAFIWCGALVVDTFNSGNVYYTGTSTQWDAIEIGINNNCLLNSNIHFESSGPETNNE